MIEVKQCADTNVYVLKNILSQEQCDYFIKEFSSITELQIIMQMPKVSEALWGFIGSKISPIEFIDEKRSSKFHVVSLKSDITISKARFSLGRHVDKKLGDDHFKLFFYLNKMSANGGTDFYGEPESLNKTSISNEAGYGVLFDISLEHGSQPFPSGEIKYVIGVRPNVNYVE